MNLITNAGRDSIHNQIVTTTIPDPTARPCLRCGHGAGDHILFIAIPITPDTFMTCQRIDCECKEYIEDGSYCCLDYYEEEN